MLARVLYHYLRAVRNMRLSSTDLGRLRDSKVRHIIRYAYENVPLYHQRLKSKGLTPGDIRGVESLRLLPTLTKTQVFRSLPRGIYSLRPPSRTLTRQTTGTTGRPLKILWDPNYCDIAQALWFRRLKMLNVRPWNKVARIIYAGTVRDVSGDGTPPRPSGFGKLWALTVGPSYTQMPVLGRKTLGIRLDPNELARAVTKLRPTVIHSQPSCARRLGRFLRGQLRVEMVISHGELLRKTGRRELADLCQGEVYETYGVHEFGTVASECTAQSGMHLNADHQTFELVRDDEQVSPGEAGEVVVTCLDNRAMPLIRYRLGDIASLHQGPCSCGSSFPRLKEVQGRTGDGLLTVDRETRVPAGMVIDYLEGTLGLKDYQLLQRNRRTIVVRLAKQFQTPDVAQTLRDYLHSLLGSDATLDLASWDNDRLPAKYRPVFSQIPLTDEEKDGA